MHIHKCPTFLIIDIAGNKNIDVSHLATYLKCYEAISDVDNSVGVNVGAI